MQEGNDVRQWDVEAVRSLIVKACQNGAWSENGKRLNATRLAQAITAHFAPPAMPPMGEAEIAQALFESKVDLSSQLPLDPPRYLNIDEAALFAHAIVTSPAIVAAQERMAANTMLGDVIGPFYEEAVEFNKELAAQKDALQERVARLEAAAKEVSRRYDGAPGTLRSAIDALRAALDNEKEG